MKQLLLPQEIEVWYILPTIRKAFALEMIKKGLSQKKIATIIGVTEAAISQYKNKRAQTLTFPNDIKIQIKKSTTKIIENNKLMFNEMMSINKKLKENGIFCKIHKNKSITPKNCETVCKKHFL